MSDKPWVGGAAGLDMLDHVCQHDSGCPDMPFLWIPGVVLAYVESQYYLLSMHRALLDALDGAGNVHGILYLHGNVKLPDLITEDSLAKQNIQLVIGPTTEYNLYMSAVDHLKQVGKATRDHLQEVVRDTDRLKDRLDASDPCIVRIPNVTDPLLFKWLFAELYNRSFLAIEDSGNAVIASFGGQNLDIAAQPRRNNKYCKKLELLFARTITLDEYFVLDIPSDIKYTERLDLLHSYGIVMGSTLQESVNWYNNQRNNPSDISRSIQIHNYALTLTSDNAESYLKAIVFLLVNYLDRIINPSSIKECMKLKETEPSTIDVNAIGRTVTLNNPAADRDVLVQSLLICLDWREYEAAHQLIDAIETLTDAM